MSRLKTILRTSLISTGLLVWAGISATASPELKTVKNTETHDFVRPIDTIQNGKARKFVVEMEAFVPPTNWLPQIKGGKATISAEVYPDKYNIHTRASVAGIVDWFVNYSSTLISNGDITDTGLQLRHYFAKDDEGRKNRSTEITHDGKTVKVNVIPEHGDLGDPAATLEQKLEAVDPISGLLQLALAPKAASDVPCSGVARVFDGKGRYNIHLENGRHVESIDLKGWKGPAYVCQVRYEELAGYKKKTPEQRAKEAKDIRWISMVLADMGPGELRVPIQIEARSEKRGKITVEAKKITYLPLEMDQADASDTNQSDQG
ncbi:DUF3108 domain-containing protein [Hirschia baltica]|uniref:DUF3108 domain-containing protein n=1 Tax=Hirschia baltica (strain ATCC 49814 / DSM 5838 / IFAM 1418) TaxID=582402 RepID=C6XPI2_HIRBI|nr:DUF3108 domain-containing protein [Hirschia baltica]ACT58468.1 hypothetical protein Hbal_0774 [Hirschia baltica ATCC 49814]